mmetsp:Transcript_19503/g.31964  ORF Transcript_19503/g.31964 Transcript_19503/m.31964 type:complete len:366 (+) Transcript_19503:90-1187(+)
MIFIWSNDGGPLQYAGLCLFALQFLLPQITNVYNLTMEIDQTHNIPLAAVSMAFLLVVIAAFGAVWMFAFNVTDNDGVNHNNSGANGNDTATEAPLGSAANPVVVDDVDDDNGHATNNNNARNSNNSEFWERNDGITPLLTSARRILNNLSPMHFLIGTGFIVPISLIIPILMDGGTAALLNDVSNNNTLQLSMLAFLAHSIMAVGAYRLLRQVLNNPDVGTYPGTRQGGRSRRTNGRRHTVGDIEGMIRKVPVEEFVSEEEIKAGSCSISKMKRMLVNRGASDSLHRCLDRSDLLEEIEKVRKYNEECTICAEQYEEGDALRVLKCRHEFHLSCLDRWVYTFATDSRRGSNNPSCPLCKTELCE